MGRLLSCCQYKSKDVHASRIGNSFRREGKDCKLTEGLVVEYSAGEEARLLRKAGLLNGELTRYRKPQSKKSAVTAANLNRVRSHARNIFRLAGHAVCPTRVLHFSDDKRALLSEEARRLAARDHGEASSQAGKCVATGQRLGDRPFIKN